MELQVQKTWLQQVDMEEQIHNIGPGNWREITSYLFTATATISMHVLNIADDIENDFWEICHALALGTARITTNLE